MCNADIAQDQQHQRMYQVRSAWECFHLEDSRYQQNTACKQMSLLSQYNFPQHIRCKRCSLIQKKSLQCNSLRPRHLHHTMNQLDSPNKLKNSEKVQKNRRGRLDT
mmetsp:Transcript_45343/g.120579  ORF Transcript_45343/g.120579 Transcript_45343/m.120579 type:complete len:106 (+) Transcript_45343:707-1024(+)